jgi:hypothetical protein
MSKKTKDIFYIIWGILFILDIIAILIIRIIPSPGYTPYGHLGLILIFGFLGVGLMTALVIFGLMNLFSKEHKNEQNKISSSEL